MGCSELVFLMVFCHIFHISAGLSCYMCPPTGASSIDDANIECLALGWDITCSPEQNRCYSRTLLPGSRVEKGCTRSENCIGTTSCCQTQFCNGDPQTSSTGYGQPCNDLSNCIQGSTVMRCGLEVQGDVTKRCLCTDNSYRRGSTCKRKSYPDESCSMTSHCLDVNTTCASSLCRCDPGMYPNVTKCDLQVGLGDLCTVNKQCGGENTQCAGEYCACAYGYLVINGTDSCSVGPNHHPTVPVYVFAMSVIGVAICGISR